MINWIKSEFNLTPLQLEYCLCAEYLGLKKTALKKEAIPEINKLSSFCSKENALIFCILDYIFNNIPINYNVEYHYNKGFSDVIIQSPTTQIILENLEQFKEFIE